MRKVPELRFDGFEGELESNRLKSLIKDIGTGSSKFNFIEGVYPILGSTGVIGYDNQFDYDGNFILIARVGANAGTLYKYNGKVKISDNTIFIKTKNQEYIYNLLLKKDLTRLVFGSGQPLVKSSELKDLRVIYTKNEEEQEKIGNLFRKIDDLIEIQESKVSKMEAFKKSMLQKMFPKKGELVPEIRFDGFDNYGFDKGKINDFIVTHGSKNYIKQPADVGTYKVIQQGDIPIAGYSNEEPYKDFSNVILFGDHTLSLFKPYEPFLLSTDGIKIIFIENIDREYFYYLVQHVMPKSQGYKRHYKILRSVKVNIPKSYKEQEKIGNFFKNLDGQIEAEEKLLDSYKMMKKSLLQKMFV